MIMVLGDAIRLVHTSISVLSAVINLIFNSATVSVSVITRDILDIPALIFNVNLVLRLLIFFLMSLY